MRKESIEKTKANDRKPMEPLFSKSSLFQRLKIAGAPNWVDAAVGFSTSGAGGAVGRGVAGDGSVCSAVGGSWAVVMFVERQWRKIGEEEWFGFFYGEWQLRLVNEDGWVRQGYTVDLMICLGSVWLERNRWRKKKKRNRAWFGFEGNVSWALGQWLKSAGVDGWPPTYNLLNFMQSTRTDDLFLQVSPFYSRYRLIDSLIIWSKILKEFRNIIFLSSN